MAFGILPSRRNPHPPGTVLLDDRLDSNNVESAISHTLKHAKGRDSHIVLVPQPSDDPNDPLNWHLCYRDSILLALVFCTFTFAGAIGPLLSPIAFALTQKYNVGFRAVTLLTGWQLLTVAICGLFVSPLTTTFGKRPVMIFTSLCGTAGSIWLVFADSYSAVVGARILQGVGVCFYEGVGFGIVADLYFVHERGARIGAFLFPLGAFNVLCPLLSGVVAQNLGIPWMFKLMAIFAGIGTAIVIFYIPETVFTRDAVYNIDEHFVEDLASGKSAEHKAEHGEEVVRTNNKHRAANITNVRTKKSYFARLMPFNNTISRESSFFHRTLAPLKLVVNPALSWACLTQGAISAWTVAVSFMLAQIFAVPPYNYNPAQVGYLYTGAMVGGLIAEIICIGLNDRMAKFLARCNGGTYEPEFRLWIIIPMLITGTIGFFGFGRGIDHGLGPIVSSTFYGFITASLIFSHVASGSYMTDAFRHVSVEIFIDVMIFKNLLFFVFSLFVNDWLTADGPTKVFDVLGGLQIIIAFMAVPVYVLGKKNRALMHSFKFMN